MGTNCTHLHVLCPVLNVKILTINKTPTTEELITHEIYVIDKEDENKEELHEYDNIYINNQLLCYRLITM